MACDEHRSSDVDAENGIERCCVEVEWSAICFRGTKASRIGPGRVDQEIDAVGLLPEMMCRIDDRCLVAKIEVGTRHDTAWRVAAAARAPNLVTTLNESLCELPPESAVDARDDDPSQLHGPNRTASKSRANFELSAHYTQPAVRPP